MARILSLVLILALILSVGAGYAGEKDRAELNPFVWMDEFTDLYNPLGFNTAWMYLPGGEEETHYFTLFIKHMSEVEVEESSNFPVIFATDGPPGAGRVEIFCNISAEDNLDAMYVVQVLLLYFVMAQMTLSTEALSEQMDLETLYIEGKDCIFRILYQSPNDHYAYESASGIQLQILGYERSPQETQIVLTMQYTGLGNFSKPVPEAKLPIPQITPRPDGQ